MHRDSYLEALAMGKERERKGRRGVKWERKRRGRPLGRGVDRGGVRK